MSDNAITEVEVLIVGGGAAGLSASMLLSSYGVDSMLVSRHPGPSNLPKAHILYQKTMEIFTEVGVAEAVYARSTPWAQWRYRGWYAGFAGDDPRIGRRIARIECWHNPSWAESSPCPPANLPQNRLEPLLKAHAETLSARPLRFGHELVSLHQEPDHVVAICRDRTTGVQYTVRAQYLLGCDGGRCVGEQIGVQLEGRNNLATIISAHVTADLSQWARDPDVLLRAIKHPETGEEVLLAPVGPDHWGPNSEEWVWSTAVPADEHHAVDDAQIVDRMRRVLGLPDINPTIHVVNRWTMEGVVATRLAVGRVFLLGDAAHRHAPTGGLGLNTAVQDAYNLCWKLTMVLRGTAAGALLETYEQERAPVAQRVVDQSLRNMTIQRGFNEVLGITADRTSAERWAALDQLWSDDPADDAFRQRFHEYLAELRAEFDSLNITFGYTYETGAIAPDGTAVPAGSDQCSIYRPSTRPGATVPAATLDRFNRSSSIFELTGAGRLVLITGEDGQPWRAAADRIVQETGLPLDAWAIGGRAADWLDWRFEWTRRREVSAGGALLVRPDRFIAWRAMDAPLDAYASLKAALIQALGTGGEAAPAAATTPPDEHQPQQPQQSHTTAESKLPA